MAFRQLHLNKSGSGMASRTACGRNILRTPLSTNWEGFKAEPAEHRCAKCAASKQFEVNTKMDARKATAEGNDSAAWQALPESRRAEIRAAAANAVAFNGTV